MRDHRSVSLALAASSTFLAALLLITPAAAGPRSGQPQSRPAVDATLEDLAWMAGHWEGEAGGTVMEELWTDPRGGLMLGLHRDVSSKGRASFEYLRIVEDERGIAYLASPMGRPATRFNLVTASGQRAVFENMAHDFPQRIIYWKTGDGLLHARIEGEQDGGQESVEWEWSRAD